MVLGVSYRLEFWLLSFDGSRRRGLGLVREFAITGAMCFLDRECIYLLEANILRSMKLDIVLI